MRLTFLGALAILFIALKLCGVVAWSWLWVLCPLWLPVAAFASTVVVGVFMLVGMLGVGMLLGLLRYKAAKPPTMYHR